MMPKNEEESWDFPHEFTSMITAMVLLGIAFLVFQLIIGGNFLGALTRGG